jgi:hypothetical protein
VTVINCSGISTGINATIGTNGKTITDERTGVQYKSPSMYLRTVASSSHRLYYERGEKYAGFTLSAAIEEARLEIMRSSIGLASLPRTEGIFVPSIQADLSSQTERRHSAF